MIEIFEGVIGGGKSYSAVLRMLAHWSRGGTVYSNLAVNWDKCKEYVANTRNKKLQDRQWRYITDEPVDEAGNPIYDVTETGTKKRNEIQNFQRWTGGGTRECPTLVIIDEAHLYWNARDWKATGTEAKEMLSFLTQSRKAHTDIIFITQSHRNLDAQMARLIQFRWTFRDLSKARLLGLSFPFQTTLAVQWDYDGKTCVSRQFQRRKAEIFELYNSHAFFTEIKRGEQVDAVDVGAKKGQSRFSKLPWGWIAIAVFVVGSCVLCYRIFSRPLTDALGTSQASSAPSPAISPVPSATFQSAGVFYDQPTKLEEVKEQPGMKHVPFCIQAYIPGELGGKLVVDHEQYGRFRVGEGDIFPPYEIICAVENGRRIPDFYALDTDTDRVVLLKVFQHGQTINKDNYELGDLLSRHRNRNNDRNGDADPKNNHLVNSGSRSGGGLDTGSDVLPPMPSNLP